MTVRGSQEFPGARFERVVGEFFEVHGFKVEHNLRTAVEGRPPFEVDLVLTWEGGARTVVEVKLFRSRTPNPADMRRAAKQLYQAQALLSADHAMLVTNALRTNLPNDGGLPHGVILFGFDDLLKLAKDETAVLGELVEIDRELSSALRDFDRVPDLSPPGPAVDLSQFQQGRPPPSPPPPEDEPEGHRLARELRELQKTHLGEKESVTLSSGREGTPWRLYEQICYDGLRYAFKELLDNWQTQKAVAGDGNRFDALAKITGNDAFCRTLVEDFRSRHILFEFKFYKAPVKPNLVHITEKYLYPAALRGTAIIISPKGLETGGVQACHGALREVGKLILDLTTDDLCALLEAKDRGTPPSEEMEKRLDRFLLGIGR